MKTIALAILTILAGTLHAQQPAPSGRGAAFDSTVFALTEVGTKVAELRGVYDLYRRAGFNEPDGAVIERAGMLGERCSALSASVQLSLRLLCRNCLARNAQPPVDQYRAYLPSLKRMADHCVTRMQTLKGRGTPAEQSAALRKEVEPAGTRIVNELRTYEVRLQAVRIAMGWAAPANIPRRSQR